MMPNEIASAVHSPMQLRGKRSSAVQRSALSSEDRERCLGLADNKQEFPKEAAEFELVMNGNLPAGWDIDLLRWKPTDKPLATRAAGGEAINMLASREAG